MGGRTPLLGQLTDRDGGFEQPAGFAVPPSFSGPISIFRC